MRLNPFSLLAKLINEQNSAEFLKQQFDQVKEVNDALKAKLAEREEESAILWRENEKLREYMKPLEAEVQRVRSMISADWGELSEEETNILLAVVQHSDRSHAELAVLYHVTEVRMSSDLEDLRAKGLVSYEGCSSARRAWRATDKGLGYLANRGLLP